MICGGGRDDAGSSIALPGYGRLRRFRARVRRFRVDAYFNDAMIRTRRTRKRRPRYIASMPSRIAATNSFSMRTRLRQRAGRVSDRPAAWWCRQDACTMTLAQR